MNKNAIIMEKMNNKISLEEIEAFLQGELSEERDKEVAEAINNDPKLQEYIETLLDIEDILLFDELNQLKQSPQFNSGSSNQQYPQIGFMGDSKIGKGMTKKNNSSNITSSENEEEYHKAANRAKTRQLKIKSKISIKAKKSDDDNIGNLIYGIVVLIIIVLLLFLFN